MEKEMRYLKIISFMIVMVAMLSCHHTSEPTRIPVEYKQLKTVYSPFNDKDNGLLDWDGQNHMSVINSIEDVYATQTELFIHENPEWLDVDFLTKSIIAIQNFNDGFDYSIGIDVTDFYISNYTEYPIKKGDYVMRIVERYKKHGDKEEDDVSQWFCYQVAIVTDKIPSDSHICDFLSIRME